MNNITLYWSQMGRSWTNLYEDIGLLNQLHWLPVRNRVRFKIAAVTYIVKTKHSVLQLYLSDDLHNYQPARTLRSSTTLLLQQPQCFTSFVPHSFTITAPNIWNSLSVQTGSADSFETFKRRLKTELFISTYAT